MLIISPFLVLFSKADIHIWLNRHHSDFFDWFFRHITFLGDGIFLLFLALLLLFYSLRSVVFLVTAYLSTGIVIQVLKRFIFEDYLRPVKYLQDLAPLHLVNGVPVLTAHSFPSGHATTAFVIFLGLAIIGRSRYVQVFCFIIACLTAYSRVYLSHHFLVDVIAGSMIGTLGTLAIYPIFYNNDLKWHNWSLKSLKRYEQDR